MERFILFYTVAGSMFGYKSKTIEGRDIDDAEQNAHRWMNGLAGKGEWEYILVRAETGFRRYNNLEQKRL